MAASLARTLTNKFHTLTRATPFQVQSFRCFQVSWIKCTEDSNLETNPTVSGSDSHSSSTEGALRKFDQVVEKLKTQLEPSNENLVDDEMQEDSFASLLRKSRQIALGEDLDKRVPGKIIEVMDDHLYIDFGGKFHCVCPRPRKNGELYQRGSEVIINLKSQEMSSAFLGSDKHITLLEADGVLLGLQQKKSSKNSSHAKGDKEEKFSSPRESLLEEVQQNV